MRPFGGGAPVDWLIVGLGNPGREHADTRHNVGFMIADELARRWDLSRGKDRFRAHIAQGRVGGQSSSFVGVDVSKNDGAAHTRTHARGAPRVAILWPQTYMNEAGRSVGPARGSLKASLDRVLVLHDEIDLPFGDIRARVGGGLAGHNGLKSIKRELGSAEFARLRVGVGRPTSTDPEIVSAYVLGRFDEPAADVDDLIARACQAVEQVVLDENIPTR